MDWETERESQERAKENESERKVLSKGQKDEKVTEAGVCA